MTRLITIALAVGLLSTALNGTSVHAEPTAQPLQKSVSAGPLRAELKPSPVEVALRAQLNEMRRSEDRLLSTVHWSLGTVATLAVGLAVFGWWSASRVYQRDIAALRDDLKRAAAENARQLKEEVQRSLQDNVAELKRQSDASYSEQRDQLLCEAISYTLTHVADLRLVGGDLEGSARSAIELYRTARRGNTNYMAHGLDKLIAVFEVAGQEANALSPELVRDVRTLLRDHPGSSEDPRVERLHSLLGAR